jgi:hypothetical protein
MLPFQVFRIWNILNQKSRLLIINRLKEKILQFFKVMLGIIKIKVKN